MKKFLSILKKHRKKIIILTVILVLVGAVVFSIYKVWKYFTPDRRESVYGDRCELTESVIISDARKKEIKVVVEEYEGMKLSGINVKCNLIDIIVKVDDEIPLATVKEMSKAMIAAFSEEELKYYDLQLYVDSDNAKSEVYPVIGTKHKQINGESLENFVW